MLHTYKPYSNIGEDIIDKILKFTNENSTKKAHHLPDGSIDYYAKNIDTDLLEKFMKQLKDE